MHIVTQQTTLLNGSGQSSSALHAEGFTSPEGYPVLTLRRNDGRVIWQRAGKNLVVKKGRSALLFWLSGQGVGLGSLSYCSLGKGGVTVNDPWTPIAPAPTDEALVSECPIIGSSPVSGKKAVASAVLDDLINPTQVTLHTSFMASEINEIVSEAGLWFADKTTLYARHTFPSAYLRIDQGNLLDVDWVVKFI